MFLFQNATIADTTVDISSNERILSQIYRKRNRIVWKKNEEPKKKKKECGRNHYRNHSGKEKGNEKREWMSLSHNSF